MSTPITVGIHEAKTHFSKLVKQAEAGEEIIVENYGRPVARIVRYEEPKAPRKLGILEGQGWVADDFDELPEEIAEYFGAA